MTRIMYDSVTARDIPRDAALVAGYVTGTYRWSPADWARFPRAVKVEIDTQADAPNIGHVLDVERGDATPAQAPGWARERRAAGVDPTVYTSFSQWGAVIDAFYAAGVTQPHYWIAKYDRIAVLPVLFRDGKKYTAVAKQYADPDRGSGGHYDLSVVADHWPGIDKEEDVATSITKDDAVLIATEVHNRTVVDPNTQKSLQARFVWADAARYSAQIGALIDEVKGLRADVAQLQLTGGGGATPAQVVDEIRDRLES